jgi:DNA-binding GntR family transcriptional regulator
MTAMPEDPALPSLSSPRPTTRAEELALRLADDIVAGRLPPGAPLEEIALAAAFGVSRTPVREALRQLAATGLVETRPRRGTLVAKPDAARLREMFLVMAELEALCAGLSAAMMAPAERRELERLHAEMGGLVRESDVPRYRAANVTFHHLLYAGARNSYLAELAAATRRRLAPFRGAQLGAPDRLQRSHEEHGEIVTAIARGDRDEAALAVRRHIGVTEATWTSMARMPRRRAPLPAA